MKIVKEFPPNMDEIKKVFHFDFDTLRPVFAYGDTLYNPYDTGIDQFLLCHEMTHQAQQRGDPAGWWKRYLEDTGFRLMQEAEAYRAQYQMFSRKFRDRNRQTRYAHQIALALSGELYGKIISYQEAMNILRKGDL